MKKLFSLLALAIGMSLFAGVPAIAFDHDRDHDRDKKCRDRDDGCRDKDGNDPPSNAPEPGSLALLAAGVVGIGGLAYVVKRKRTASN